MESEGGLILGSGVDGWRIGWQLGELWCALQRVVIICIVEIFVLWDGWDWCLGTINVLIPQTVLILKYIIPQYDGYIYYGGANVGMNAGVMLSYV